MKLVLKLTWLIFLQHKGYWLKEPKQSEPLAAMSVDYRTERYRLDDLFSTLK